MEYLVANSCEGVLSRTTNSISTDNSRYRALSIGKDVRGDSYTRMYVSKEVLLDEKCVERFFDTMLPQLVNPWYYGLGKRDDPYDWREHVYVY